MGYLLSFMLFMWGLLACHNGGQDIIAAGLFIGSALFYVGAHIGALVEAKEIEDAHDIWKIDAARNRKILDDICKRANSPEEAFEMLGFTRDEIKNLHEWKEELNEEDNSDMGAGVG